MTSLRRQRSQLKDWFFDLDNYYDKIWTSTVFDLCVDPIQRVLLTQSQIATAVPQNLTAPHNPLAHSAN